MVKKFILYIAIMSFAIFVAACSSVDEDISEPAAEPAFETVDTPVAEDAPDDVPPPDAADADTPDDAEGQPEAQQGFVFEAYGQQIHISMEAAPLLEKLPEPSNIFEQPSCAFDGIDITYFYPGFELTTYPDSGKEHVLSVVFTDDSIATPEGVYLGGSLRDIQSAYGTGYTQDGNRYIYTDGRESLIFNLEDGTIMGIIYTLITD